MPTIEEKNQEAGWIIKAKEGKPESPVSAHREMAEQLKSAPGGQVIAGAVGESVATAEPEEEIWNAEEEAEKELLVEFLMNNLTPPKLAIRHNDPESDRASMEHKLKTAKLADIKRVWPGDIPGEPLTAVQKVELNRHYRDISL